ncbi:hypothetical protein ACLMJK_008152 [Lecanora helva]
MDDYQRLHPDSFWRIPGRPEWVDETAHLGPLTQYEAAQKIMNEWRRWANEMERKFRLVLRHAKSLDIPDDVYIGFIRMVAHHPARPEIPSIEDIQKCSTDEEFPVPLFELNMAWETYADVIETTYREMARELSWRKFDWSDGDLGLGELSLTDDAISTDINNVRSILTHMLGPGRSFGTVSDIARRRPSALSNNNPRRILERYRNAYLSQQRAVNQEVERLRIESLSIRDRGMEDEDSRASQIEEIEDKVQDMSIEDREM